MYAIRSYYDLGKVPAGDPDHLLAGVDLLEGLLDDLATERPERDINGFLSKIPATDNAGDPVPVTTGHLVYQVTIDLAAETPVPAARALLILRDLQNQGEILNAIPPVATLRQGGTCRRLQVWLRT